MAEHIPFMFQGNKDQLIKTYFPNGLPNKGDYLVLEVYDVRGGETTPQQEVVPVSICARWRIIACPPLPTDDVTREG